MSLAHLIKAAELARDYSQSRRCKVDLLLVAEGVLVTGSLLDEFGRSTTHRYNFIVTWPQVMEREVSILAAVEEVHAKVTDAWRGKSEDVACEHRFAVGDEVWIRVVGKVGIAICEKSVRVRILALNPGGYVISLDGEDRAVPEGAVKADA